MDGMRKNLENAISSYHVAAERRVARRPSESGCGPWSSQGDIVVPNVSPAHAEVEDEDASQLAPALGQSHGVVAGLDVPVQVANRMQLLNRLQCLNCRADCRAHGEVLGGACLKPHHSFMQEGDKKCH